MRRGVEILIMWLIIAGCANFLAPHSIPQNGFERLVYFVTVISFPLAAWIYARHTHRVSPVICFGLVAGAFTILPVFEDGRGMPRDITLGWILVIGGVPVLMMLVCLCFHFLRRWSDKSPDG